MIAVSSSEPSILNLERKFASGGGGGGGSETREKNSS